jgi:hypothetical protein
MLGLAANGDGDIDVELEEELVGANADPDGDEVGHDQPDLDNETEECRMRLIASVESLEQVTLTRQSKVGTAYVDDDKKFAVIAAPSKLHPRDDFWYTIFNKKPDHYHAADYKVMFAFGMAGESDFIYIPYATMKQIAMKLHTKLEGRGWYMCLRKEDGKYHVAKNKRSRKTVVMATPFLKPLGA